MMKVFLAFVSTCFVLAAASAGELTKFQVCASGDQDFRFVKPESDIFWYYDYKVLDCESDADYHLFKTVKTLNKETKKFEVHGYEPVADFAKNSPKAIFLGIKRKLLGGAISTVKLRDPKARKTFAFYLVAAPEKCAEKSSEVRFMAATEKKDHTVEFSEETPTGLCVKDADSFEKDGIKANLLDSNEDGKKISVAVLGKDEILGLTLDLETGNATKLFLLGGAEWMPHQCGQYFKGLRFLPGTSKIAFFYASPRVVFYDTADDSSKEMYNGNDPNAGRTCEGPILNYGYITKDVRIDLHTKTVNFINRNLKTRKLEETVIEYGP